MSEIKAGQMEAKQQYFVDRAIKQLMPERIGNLAYEVYATLMEHLPWHISPVELNRGDCMVRASDIICLFLDCLITSHVCTGSTSMGLLKPYNSHVDRARVHFRSCTRPIFTLDFWVEVSPDGDVTVAPQFELLKGVPLRGKSEKPNPFGYGQWDYWIDSSMYYGGAKLWVSHDEVNPQLKSVLKRYGRVLRK